MTNRMLLIVAWMFLLSLESLAQVPQTFVYHGQILQNGTTPLEANPVIFTVKVVSPGAEGCVLYEEQHSINMTGSNGVFSLNVGNGVRSGTDYEDSSNLFNVFSNVTTFSSLSTCSSGTSYTPASTHTRKLRVSYYDGVTNVTLSQDHHLQATPFAWYANSLQGMLPSNFVQVRPAQNLTQSNLENIFGGTNYTSLLSLIAGSSPLYVKANLNGAQIPGFGSTPAGVTTGSMWYDSVQKQMRFYDGTSVHALGGVGTGLGTVLEVTAGAGLTGGTITTTGTIEVANDGITTSHILDGTVADVDLASGIDASKITTGTLPISVVPPDPTKLSLSGGTMTGDITMDGHQILATGHITMSPLSTITMGKYDATQETTLAGALSAANKGAVWFNSVTNTLMYWDGSAVQTVSNQATAGGDITEVIAGSGLSGGGTSGAVTVSVPTDGITSTHILDGTIASADIADGAVINAKIDSMAASKLTGIVDNTNLPIGNATTQLFTIDQVPHCTVNQKLEMSLGPIYAWSCVADADSGGDITEVNTTAPLAGGGTTGALTLSIGYDNSSIGMNGSSQLEVKDSGVTDAKIVAVAVDKITSASGKYFSYMPNGSECGDDEILKWDATNDRWACGTDTNLITSVFGRTGVVTAQNGDYTATQITNTAAGNIAATTAQAAINELDSEKVSKAGDTMTGQLTMTDNIAMNAQNEVRFGDSDSSNYVALRAAGTVASNVTWTLPAADGTSGQLLSTNGSGTLSWIDAAIGDITGVTTNSGSGLSGGAASGAATLQVVVDDSTIEIATNSLQVKAGGIAASHLAADSVTSAKIVDGTVASADLANAAVTDAKIDTVSVDKIISGVGKYLTYMPNNASCSDGQVLKWNNTDSRWDCGTDDNAGGDITAVNTTAPLAGGGTTGALTLTIGYDNTSVGMNGSNQLEVKASGVTATHLAADSVTTAKIADGQVTDAKIVAVAVDKITSASGKYFSYMPNGAECTAGQVLEWDATNDRWACADDDNTNLITSVFGRTGVVTAQNGDYTATQITNTAAGNIAATTAQAAINELDSEKLAKAGDTMTGQLTMTDNIVMNAQNEVRFADSDSSNFVAFRAAGTVASDVTWTLPAADGTSGQLLSTNGSGTLSWIDAAIGDITGVTTNSGSGLSGGVATGSATLQVVVDDSTIEIATNSLQIKDAGVTDAKIADVGVDKITSGVGKYLTYLPNNAACTDGQVLKWDNTNSRWACGADDNAGGDITGVTAGTGLTGGGTTGAVSLAIDFGDGANQVQQNMDIPNCLSTQKLEMSAGPTYVWTCVTDNDSGGDITAVNTTAPLSGGGTTGALTLSIGYDNSSIGMNGSDQLEIKASGVTDAKIADVGVDKITSGAGKYFTYLPNNAACTDGQVLKWDNTNSRWECGNDTDTNTDAVASVFGRTGVIAAQNGDYTATQITNTAAGDISATTAQAAINELDSEKLAKSGDTMTGQLTMTDNVVMNAQNEVRFADSDSSNFVALRSPASVTSDVTWTLPAADGTSGQLLSTNGSGALSWIDAAIGDITGVTTNSGSGLSGGAATGSATLQVVVDDSTIEIATNSLQIKDAGVTDAKIADVGVDKITSGVGKYFTYLPNNAACTDGQVLKWDNTNSRWACGGDDNAGGDITGITAGTGLTGGGTTGAVSLAIDFGDGANQVQQNMDIPNCLSTQKLEMSAGPTYVWSCVTDNDSGGDITAVNTTAPLSGGGATGALTLTIAYDNSTIGINGSNQLEVKANGVDTAQIANSAVTDAKIADVGVDKITSGSGKYFTYLPNNAACTDGQVLKWDNSNTRWECGNDTDTNTDAVASVFGRTGVVAAQVGDYTATQITNTAAGNIAATTAQAAINELDSEKLAKSGDTMSGALTMTDNIVMNAQNEVRFADSDSSNFVALRSPASVTGDVTWTLPAADGASGQLLSTNGSGTLGWIDAAVGDITGVTTNSGSGLSGGAATGSPTLQVVVDGSTIEIATNSLRLKDAGVTDAKIADVGVDKIASGSGKYFTYLPNNAACTNGQTLKWSTSSTRWECGTDSDTGDITGVTAGTGLTGGGTSGAPTLEVDIGTAGTQLSTNDDIPHCTSTQKLEMSAGPVYVWSCVTDANSGGDITAVTTTAPLSGGASSGAVALTLLYDSVTIGINGSNELQVNDGSITTAKMVTGAVTTNEILDATIATGDIAGSAITSAKIADGTVSTNDLADGAITNVKIASVDISKIASSAGNYFTYLPNNAACTNGQTLKWSTSNTRWECGADNDTGDITAVTAGSGLTGGATTGAVSLAIDTGTGSAQFQNNSAIPNCAIWEKLSMSAGPVYSWSCAVDDSAHVLNDYDSDTKITVEASADEDIIRFNTAGNERMQIDGTGNVGMGADAGTDKLRVYGDVRLGTTGSSGCVKAANGGTITGTCSSDVRLKKNIHALGPVSEKLARLAPKTYEWRAEQYPEREYGSGVELGLIAQEVLKQIPDLVEVDQQGYYRIKYHQVPFYLIQGFSEQHREISSLTQKINDLEVENKDLKKRLEAIEKMLRVKQ